MRIGCGSMRGRTRLTFPLGHVCFVSSRVRSIYPRAKTAGRRERTLGRPAHFQGNPERKYQDDRRRLEHGVISSAWGT